MSEKDIASAAAADGETKLTAGETKFFTVMFKYLPKTVEIDWDEFAKEMGFKNGSIAKVRLHSLTYLFTMFHDPLLGDGFALFRLLLLI